MRKHAVVIALLLMGYVALVWVAGTALQFSGTRLWILRGALWLLGLLAAASIFWLLWRNQRATVAPEKAVAAPAGGQIGFLLREAERKLAAARQEGLGRLPAYFVLGGGGCAKTSAIVHSGMNAELLAGEVFRDGAVVPTPAANFWFANGVLFTEFGGALQHDERGWTQLVNGLRPAKLGAVLGKGTQAPRAVLVCFDAEILIGPGGPEAAAISARNLRRRIGEICESLGIRLPVYVLFTRCDRISFFQDYVANMSDTEARQPLGQSLPLSADERGGVYAENAGSRIGEAFDRIFRKLSDGRPEFLTREHDASRLGAVYEFPREFRKLRRTIVDLLIELCRPSQLAAGPFLRGFYFSGVRPVMVQEAAPAQAARSQGPLASTATEATSIFRVGMGASAAAAQPVMTSRRAPQWVFLSQLFENVLLQDHAAMGASRTSSRTSRLRRVLLACCIVLALALASAFTISFLRNQTLASRIAQSATAVVSANQAAALPASLGRLEALRSDLELLSDYGRDGVPWSLRWGLYTGDDLLPAARRAYFTRFHQVLLGDTQAALASELRALPKNPGPDYGTTYADLKAYLITTSNHDKSTAAFLTPVLLGKWSAGRNSSPEVIQLARKQFDFYARELRDANPFTEANDSDAVENARHYLGLFAGVERVYQAMLADAAKAGVAINFNKRFPATVDVVSNSHEVSGAFTKAGWDFMSQALKNPDHYFSGEQWVLGNTSASGLDRAQLPQQLRARYSADFIGQWRAYLNGATVARYASLQDAARKLNTLSGNQSPLLALLSLASQNTAVDAPEVTATFQPVQAVVPPGSLDRYIAPSNQNYMNALVTLQAGVQSIASQPAPDDAAAAQVSNSASSAHVATRQLAQAFRIDSTGHVESVVEKLLQDPITNAEGVLRTVGPAELNAKGKALCGQMRPLLSKYPFNPASSLPAAAFEVNSVFRKPDGALWAAYDSSLQKLLVRQGSQYVPNPGGAVRVNPAFASFFTRAAAISDALYAGGSQDPHFNFSLKPVATEGIQNLGLHIDGQHLEYSGGTPQAKQFTWQSSGVHQTRATVRFGNGPELAWATADGLWAVFHFFDKAEQWRFNGNTAQVEWTIRIGRDPVTLPGGNPLTVRYELDMQGAPPLLQKGYLAGTGCIADITR